ncbi:unnamed protein product [Linum trigynum]|uniref:Secreted protein n=1 Tax=Linum trigynum TaxID=586398 RepID=A0AAV2GMR5_9ROSI
MSGLVVSHVISIVVRLLSTQASHIPNTTSAVSKRKLHLQWLVRETNIGSELVNGRWICTPPSFFSWPRFTCSASRDDDDDGGWTGKRKEGAREAVRQRCDATRKGAGRR